MVLKYMRKMACKICDNIDGNKIIIVREMMFGRRDEFEYIECKNCGCLQIKNIPKNLDDYYPPDYYSFIKQEIQTSSRLKHFLKYQRAQFYLNRKNLLGYVMAKLFPGSDCYKWLKIPKANCRILDVGCGTGQLLVLLKNEGFSNYTGSNLRGLDPYINNDITYGKGLTISKESIYEVQDSFDYIMMHHSFEHMDQPLNVLKHLCKILRPNRYLLIRIPVASSYAYRKYGSSWVQIDAPRHIFLHTVESMKLLAGKAGFEIREIVYDSNSFQFWGSEQYKADIPLNDSKSFGVNKDSSIFSEMEIEEFNKKAIDLNMAGEGDSACFYLYKKNHYCPNVVFGGSCK